MTYMKRFIEQLERLTTASEHYYKWSNNFDLKIDCFKLKQEISNSKELIAEYHKNTVD